MLSRLKKASLAETQGRDTLSPPCAQSVVSRCCLYPGGKEADDRACLLDGLKAWQACHAQSIHLKTCPLLAASIPKSLARQSTKQTIYLVSTVSCCSWVSLSRSFLFLPTWYCFKRTLFLYCMSRDPLSPMTHSVYIGQTEAIHLNCRG